MAIAIIGCQSAHTIMPEVPATIEAGPQTTCRQPVQGGNCAAMLTFLCLGLQHLQSCSMETGNAVQQAGLQECLLLHIWTAWRRCSSVRAVQQGLGLVLIWASAEKVAGGPLSASWLQISGACRKMFARYPTVSGSIGPLQTCCRKREPVVAGDAQAGAA